MLGTRDQTSAFTNQIRKDDNLSILDTSKQILMSMEVVNSLPTFQN